MDFLQNSLHVSSNRLCVNFMSELLLDESLIVYFDFFFFEYAQKRFRWQLQPQYKRQSL